MTKYNFYFFQVETELFIDLKGKNLHLKPVSVEETIVTDFIEQGVDILKANTTGPQT